MAPSTQPPEETFCMNCGPDAPLERHDGAVLRMAAWLRTNIEPCYDTSLLTPGQTADRIATWMRHHLTAAGISAQQQTETPARCSFKQMDASPGPL